MKSLEELQEELDEIIDAGFYYDPKELEDACAFEAGEAKGRTEGIAIGKAEGIAIGEAKGEAKTIINFTKKLLAKDFPVTEISEMTGLTEEEIKKLK